jgi:hypothetical protein
MGVHILDGGWVGINRRLQILDGCLHVRMPEPTFVRVLVSLKQTRWSGIRMC